MQVQRGSGGRPGLRARRRGHGVLQLDLRFDISFGLVLDRRHPEAPG